jgi:F-type H+-transporting ATPase subunit g
MTVTPTLPLFWMCCHSLPGRYKALWEEVDYVKKKVLQRDDLKLEEIGIAALFAGECYAWFCVGEIVGRGGTITGYKV